ncbi:hypothetical protein AA12717_0879 [Gluconacetobacter sacchari DSM 12717]|nr:hypothetical protein AA12717_0879 [Gluconacetobacter sacchari DSM 12717]
MTSAPIAMGLSAAPAQYPPAGFAPPGIALIAFHIAESQAIEEGCDPSTDYRPTALSQTDQHNEIAAAIAAARSRARLALADHHWTQAIKLVRALQGSRSGREQLAAASMFGVDLGAVLERARA